MKLDDNDMFSDTQSIFIGGSRKSGVRGGGKEQYFVSNIFVEKIFDEISAKQDMIKLKLEAQIDELTEKVMSVIDIREVELPDY